MKWKNAVLLTVLSVIHFTVLATTPMVAAGDSHSIGLSADGNVFSWGDDTYGQLGQGRLLFSSTAASIKRLPPIIQIAAGGSHILTLASDGSVWAWGSNQYGQLGDGSTLDRSEPVHIHNLSNVVAVSAGLYHSLAVKDNGTVWAWGSNYYGALGNNDNGPDRLTPVQVTGLSDVVGVSAGLLHSLALKRDGSAWSWGWNQYGQLGDGSTTPRRTPGQVSGLTGIVALDAASHSLALKSDGSVWAWGYNYYGQVGDGSTVARWTPVQVPNLSGVVSIAAGDYHSLAAKSDGSAWAWGYNYNGQLGDPSSVGLQITGLTPVQVLNLSGAKLVAASGRSSFAIDNGGRVWAWGFNRSGQLGDGSTNDRSIPGQVMGLSGVVAIAGGGDTGLDLVVALTTESRIWTWGANNKGQMADGSYSRRTAPIHVTNLPSVVAVAASAWQSFALTGDGSVWAWGYNYNGQLGVGNSIDRSLPAQVVGLSSGVALAAGQTHTLAIKSDGTIWAWGTNDYGELGTGNWSDPQPTPVKVVGLSGVVAVAAGLRRSLALKNDGSVWGWGWNLGGALGDGSTIDRLTPTLVTGMSGVIAVATGQAHSLALKSDGSVWAWGENRSGALGDGSSEARLTPVRVIGLSNVVAIAAAWDHSLAVKNDGTVWAWGNGYNYPIQALGFSTVAAVATGVLHSVAWKSDGTVVSIGENTFGQQGDGTLAWHPAPVLAANTSVDGFLNLKAGTAVNVNPELQVPFFAFAVGSITDTSAEVKTTTKFNSEDKGKEGAVYITARVPAGSLGTTPIAALTLPQQAEKLLDGVIPSAYAQTASSPTVLIQLTPTGWQPVTNGQLIPYASGVLGDALAAQTILNGVDTTNLKGAEFCLGYGTSASEMGAAGRMRTVATIPGGTSSIGCLPLTIPRGWNLLGHGLNQSFPVASLYGDTSWVNSVWKWDTSKSQWQFYAPLMDSATLSSFTKDKGYGILTDIFPGEGYWVNATKPSSVFFQSGSPYKLTSSNLKAGWNLAATGATTTPSAFNTSLSTTPPTAGTTPQNFTSLWAWDSKDQGWYFYAPSLEAQGETALTDYLTSKDYKDFSAAGKTLGPTTGFWVNRP